jgi:hypothetical protein
MDTTENFDESNETVDSPVDFDTLFDAPDPDEVSDEKPVEKKKTVEKSLSKEDDDSSKDDENTDDDDETDDDNNDDTDDKSKKTSKDSNLKAEQEQFGLATKTVLDALGVQLEDDADYEATSEGLREMVQDAVIETLPDDVKDVVQFMLAGGDIKDFAEIRETQSSLKEFDLTNQDNQKLIIEEYLRAKGNKEKDIQRLLSGYEEDNEFEEKSQEAFTFFENLEKDQEKTLIEQKTREREQLQHEYIKVVNTTKTYLDKTDEIKGFPISKREKQEIQDYLFKADKTGKTEWQKLLENPENHVAAAHFILHGEKLNRAVKTGTATKIKDLLKEQPKLKGNPNTFEDELDVKEEAALLRNILRKAEK